MPVSRRQSNRTRINPYTLMGWSLQQLQTELSNRGFSAVGSKTVLIERLRDHLLLDTPPEHQLKSPDEIKKEPADQETPEASVSSSAVAEEKKTKEKEPSTPKRKRKTVVKKELVEEKESAEEDKDGGKKSGKVSKASSKENESADDDPVEMLPGETLAEALKKKYHRKRVAESSGISLAPVPPPAEEPDQQQQKVTTIEAVVAAVAQQQENDEEIVVSSETPDPPKKAKKPRVVSSKKIVAGEKKKKKAILATVAEGSKVHPEKKKRKTETPDNAEKPLGVRKRKRSSADGKGSEQVFKVKETIGESAQADHTPAEKQKVKRMKKMKDSTEKVGVPVSGPATETVSQQKTVTVIDISEEPTPEKSQWADFELNMDEWEIIGEEEIGWVKKQILLQKLAERNKRAMAGSDTRTAEAKTAKATKDKEKTESQKEEKTISAEEYSSLPSVVAETLLGIPAKGLTAGQKQANATTKKAPPVTRRQKQVAAKPQAKPPDEAQGKQTTDSLSEPVSLPTEEPVSVSPEPAVKSALDARIEAIIHGPENRENRPEELTPSVETESVKHENSGQEDENFDELFDDWKSDDGTSNSDDASSDDHSSRSSRARSHYSFSISSSTDSEILPEIDGAKEGSPAVEEDGGDEVLEGAQESEENLEEEEDERNEEREGSVPLNVRIPEHILTLIPSMIAEKRLTVEQIPNLNSAESDETNEWTNNSAEALLEKALKVAIPIGDKEESESRIQDGRFSMEVSSIPNKSGEARVERKSIEGTTENAAVEEEYEPDGDTGNFWRQRKEVDPEPPLDLTEVQLDSYNADESIKVESDHRSIGVPVIQDGYALMWSGIKASYGFRKGKLAFQVKILEFMDTSHLVVDETYPHDMRVGWSMDNAPYVLGEAQNSYGYCSIAKKVENGTFSDWGESYDKDDVVTCCMDFDTGEITYYKNKEGLGAAFTVNLENCDEKSAFFPHILTKNCKFKVNFGQLGEWMPIPEEFRFVNEAPEEDRVRGLVAPDTKKECTVLMMVGLPGCGKTRFVNRYVKDHPDEKWCVLSADVAMDRMKVNGVPRHRCHHGRWDILMGLAAKAVTKMIQLACRKKKNYIIDQTNVMFMARRRKLALFRDFSKKALVMVPTQEDFANRRQKQVQETNMEMPAEAMLEMKSMFLLPNLEYEPFHEIIFIEPSSGDPENDRLTAQRAVERFNEEGKAWRPWQLGPQGPRRPLNPSERPPRRRMEAAVSAESTESVVVVSAGAVSNENVTPGGLKELRVDVSERRSTAESSDLSTPSASSPSPSPAGGVGAVRWAGQSKNNKVKHMSSFAKPGWANAKNGNRGFAGFEAGEAPSYIPPPPAVVNVTTLGTEITADLITID